jgi:hypothetical protein
LAAVPKRETKRPFTVRLPESLRGILDALAREDRRETADYVRIVLEDHAAAKMEQRRAVAEEAGSYGESKSGAAKSPRVPRSTTALPARPDVA